MLNNQVAHKLEQLTKVVGFEIEGVLLVIQANEKLSQSVQLSLVAAELKYLVTRWEVLHEKIAPTFPKSD